MSGTVEGWSGRKLPKNIRQVGETEGQNRIYLEDYVYTYVRKALEKRTDQAVAGFLTGTWEDRNVGRCYFIKGAMVVEGLLAAKESAIEDTPLWKKNRDLAEYYFPGQEFLGWFLHTREEGFFDETEKQTMHRHMFSQGESLFFQFEEEENRFYFGNDAGLTAAGGFYIYYERNVDMQNYMLDTGQAAPEEIALDDTAILQYRSIMKERKKQAGRKQEVLLKRACIGLTAAVVFLSLYTWGEQRALSENSKNNQDAVAVGASVQMQDAVGESQQETEAPDSQTAAGTEAALSGESLSGTETDTESLTSVESVQTPENQSSAESPGVEEGQDTGETESASADQPAAETDGIPSDTEPAESAAVPLAGSQMN